MVPGLMRAVSPKLSKKFDWKKCVIITLSGSSVLSNKLTTASVINLAEHSSTATVFFHLGMTRRGGGWSLNERTVRLPASPQTDTDRKIKCVSVFERGGAVTEPDRDFQECGRGGGDLTSPTLPSLANVTVANLCNSAGWVDKAPVWHLPPTDYIQWQ